MMSLKLQVILHSRIYQNKSHKLIQTISGLHEQQPDLTSELALLWVGGRSDKMISSGPF